MFNKGFKVKYAVILSVLIVLVLVTFFSLQQAKKAFQGRKVEVKNQDIRNYQLSSFRSNDRLLGKVDAPVKIVVYEDLSSIFSADYAVNLDKVRNEFGDKIAIAFRSYPVKSENLSFSAALAGECANEQSRFFEMRKEIYNQVKKEQLNPDTFLQTAQSLGLNVENFSACFDNRKYFKKLNDELAESKQGDVYGAPTTFINGEIVVGAKSWEDTKNSEGKGENGLESIIKRHLLLSKVKLVN
ncbi:MAG: DsbA family protein [Planctomycetes bacterium]|jgi:protein-disulfide isomerase|nr:DsbA family protein [Planctomycetota bacterium]